MEIFKIEPKIKDSDSEVQSLLEEVGLDSCQHVKVGLQ